MEVFEGDRIQITDICVLLDDIVQSALVQKLLGLLRGVLIQVEVDSTAVLILV